MNSTDPISVDYSFTAEMSDEEKAQYWQTQQSLFTVSALTKSYGLSCALLGYDYMTPTPFPGDLDKKTHDQLAQHVAIERRTAVDAGEEPGDRPLGPPPKVLVLNGWQVMGASHVNGPSVPYLDLQHRTRYPCTRTSSVPVLPH